MSHPFTVSRRSLLAGGLGLVGASMLGACSSSTESTSQATSADVTLPKYLRYAEGATPDIAGTAAGLPDVFLTYPKTHTATSAPPGDGSRFVGSVPHAATMPALNDSNSFWTELRRRMGEDLQLNITPVGDYPARFATAAAGNELGDMFNVPGNLNGLPAFLKAQAADLTPYLSGDAVTAYPFLANLPTDSWKGTVYNGGIYALPISRGVQSSVILYTRNDLFEQAGVDPQFSSVDELVEAAEKLTVAGKNQWGLASVPLVILQGMYEVPNNWGVIDGKLIANYESPAFEQVLATGAQLIKSGYVHPDSIATPPANQKIWLNGGSAAMMQDTYTAASAFYVNNTAGDAFDLGVPTLAGKMWLGRPINSISAIKKGDEARVKLCLAIANWLAAPIGTTEYEFVTYGQQGIDFELDQGEPVITPKGSAQMGVRFPVEYLSTGPRPLYLPGLPDVAKRLRSHMDAIISTAVPDATYGYYSETSSRQGNSLSTKMTDAINEVLTGRQPVSSWKDTVTSWRSGGGDKIRAEFETALGES